MKEIKAYIKPHKLIEVTLGLHGVEGLTGMSVIEARGFGRGHRPGDHETAKDAFDYVPCMRIEIVCTDALVDSVIGAIREFAHTGLKGDGKIYVTDVHDAIRIGTGEHGENAV